MEEPMDIDDIPNTEDEQNGNSYTIQLLRQRQIRKFNVQGSDFHVKVNGFDRKMDFSDAVQLLRNILTGKPIDIFF